MRQLAQRLIAEELATDSSVGSTGQAAFRVCAKLRPSLCTFAGAAGYRSLMARALALARAEAPLLSGVQLMADGLFHYSSELEAKLGTPEAGVAASALTRHLLGLLITFIGEALTLRLVQDVWPKAALKDSKPAENSP
jgi:hypothetical protein